MKAIAGRIQQHMAEYEQLDEALTAYFEGKDSEAERTLERLNETNTNPVVPYTLRLMNALRKNVDYPKMRRTGTPTHKTSWGMYVMS